MSFGGGGDDSSKISTSADVALSSPTDSQGGVVHPYPNLTVIIG